MNKKTRSWMPFLLVISALFFSSIVSQPGLAQESIQEEKGTIIDVFKTFRDGIIPGYSEMYAPPSDTDLNQMQKLVSLILISVSTNDTAKLSESSLEASRIGYEFVRLINENTSTVYYILREAAGKNRGWGLYIFRAGIGSSDLVIEAPHPIYDLHTDRIAVLAFDKSRAKAFLVAGAHRKANRDRSADAANFPRSIFQAVHEAVTKSSTTVIDIHGFTLKNEPGYPQIILSSGDGTATLPIREFSSILEAKNFTTGIANGGKLKELEAANDMQGRYANSIGANFIHMELESSIRNYPLAYRRVVVAINEFDFKYLNTSIVGNFSNSNTTLNQTFINLKEPIIKRFTKQLKHELWYYMAAILVMFGAFIILLLERRNSKIT